MFYFIAFSSAAFVFFSMLVIFVERFPFLVGEMDRDQVFLLFYLIKSLFWRIPGDKKARVEGLDLTNVQCTTLRCPISSLKQRYAIIRKPDMI